jgi:hypothetical protein
MWLGVRFLIYAYEKIRLEWWKLRTNIVVTKKEALNNKKIMLKD